MTLRHLRIFVAVCENGGVTHAAAALHMAQPSVSVAVSETERYYGVALFDRIGKRMILTDAGRELLTKAKEVLADFDDFERAARESGRSPALRIGSSMTLGVTVLPRYLTVLRAECPDILPTVTVGRASSVEEALEAGRLDFIMTEGEVLSPRLRTFPFGGDRLSAAAAAGSDAPGSLSLEALLAYPLLLREKGSASRDWFDRLLAARRLTARPFLESADNECLLAAAAAGVGVAVLPGALAQPLVDRGALREIAVDGGDFRRPYFLAVRRNKQLSPRQREAFALCLTFGGRPARAEAEG